MAVEMGKFLGEEKQTQIFDYLAENGKPLTLKELQEHLVTVSLSKNITRYGEIVRLISHLKTSELVKSNYLSNAPDENGTSTAEITERGLKVYKLLKGVSEIIRI